MSRTQSIQASDNFLLAESGMRELIERKALRPLIERATELVCENFPLTSEPTLARVEDTESGAEWIEIHAKVRGDRSSVREGHRRFTQAWLKTVPREQSMEVRLAISFA